MAFFDKAKAQGAPEKATNSSVRTKKVTFGDIPESMAAFAALPQAGLSDPFDTAALTVAALCLYTADKELCFKMLDYLRGPRPLNGADKQFLADRFRGKEYIMR